jgi:hypothetical protein
MNDQVPIGPLISRIVSALGIVLILALAGLVLLGLFGGDPAVGMTLTHVIETVVGVFIGIAAGRLASDS